MTDFNKLADALDDTASRSTSLMPDQRLQIIEAARILRAAGAADVGWLMGMHDAAARAFARYLVDGGNDKRAAAEISRHALESALRVALAGRGK
jgi:hypothetical protein